MKVKVTAKDEWSGKKYCFKAELKEGSPEWFARTRPSTNYLNGVHYFVSEKDAKKLGGHQEVEVCVGDVIEVLCPA